MVIMVVMIEKEVFAQTLEALLENVEMFVLQLGVRGINLASDVDTSSLTATFANTFDAVHRILGSDILYSDVSPLYSDVECPCGSASLSYWDTTVDEREKMVIQFQCDECNRILNVEYRVVSITEEKADDDDGVEEEIVDEAEDGVEKEIT
jgi:hypothetical protein